MSNERTSSAWRERLASPLTWHYAGFAVLLLLTIALAIRLGLDWAATNGHSTDVLAGKQVELKALDLQTAPLRGLDKRVEDTRAQMRAFYDKRIPPNYSSISAASASWKWLRASASRACSTRKASPAPI